MKEILQIIAIVDTDNDRLACPLSRSIFSTCNVVLAIAIKYTL